MGTRTFVNDRLSFSPAKNMSRGMDMPLVLTVVALLVFGLIFLGEELYETGVVLLALRAGQRGLWA